MTRAHRPWVVALYVWVALPIAYIRYLMRRSN